MESGEVSGSKGCVGAMEVSELWAGFRPERASAATTQRDQRGCISIWWVVVARRVSGTDLRLRNASSDKIAGFGKYEAGRGQEALKLLPPNCHPTATPTALQTTVINQAIALEEAAVPEQAALPDQAVGPEQAAPGSPAATPTVTAQLPPHAPHAAHASDYGTSDEEASEGLMDWAGGAGAWDFLGDGEGGSQPGQPHGLHCLRGADAWEIAGLRIGSDGAAPRMQPAPAPGMQPVSGAGQLPSRHGIGRWGRKVRAAPKPAAHEPMGPHKVEAADMQVGSCGAIWLRSTFRYWSTKRCGLGTPANAFGLVTRVALNTSYW